MMQCRPSNSSPVLLLKILTWPISVMNFLKKSMNEYTNMPMKPSILPFLIFQFLLINFHPPSSSAAPTPAVPTPQSSALFREYIGAEFNGVKFSDVPINPNVEFHFILSFAIDYTPDGNSSTDGLFNVFWDSQNLSAPNVNLIRQNNCNVKVALSLGGDTVNGQFAYFNPKSIDSWVDNAVSSLTKIIREYNLDGIDIDYEHFSADPDTFAECIGRLLKTLKCNNVISFASIAPYDYYDVQSHYIALWKKYGDLIDYVNFQFYAYPANTTVSQFLSYFEIQSANYEGGKVLVSFTSDTSSSGGLSPDKGFFTACKCLKMEGKLHGIFIWSADDSVKYRFRYEEFFQNFLAGYF